MLLMLRRLKSEFREFPAMMVLGTLWVVVFSLMAISQGQRGHGLSIREFVLGPIEGHRFGDMTIRDVYQGEIWRSLTATFVHFGFLHIAINLLGFYQIGTLVESWYGSGSFLGIYLLTGGGGNLLSAWARHALHSHPGVHCGGGSTVIMGLVALCAVVAWGGKTPGTASFRNSMLVAIALTFGLGAGASAAGFPVIDNWGHAGGAVMGAVLGLGNRVLIRQSGKLPARLMGWITASLLLASGALLVADDQGDEASNRRLAEKARIQAVEQARRRILVDERLLGQLQRIRETYKVVATPRAIKRGTIFPESLWRARRNPPGPSPAVEAPKGPVSPGAATVPVIPSVATSLGRFDADQEFTLTLLNASLRFLNSLVSELDTGENSADYHRAREILSLTLTDWTTLEQVREFDDRLSSIQARIRSERDKARALAQAPRDRVE